MQESECLQGSHEHIISSVQLYQNWPRFWGRRRRETKSRWQVMWGILRAVVSREGHVGLHQSVTRRTCNHRSPVSRSAGGFSGLISHRISDLFSRITGWVQSPSHITIIKKGVNLEIEILEEGFPDVSKVGSLSWEKPSNSRRSPEGT